ncbi:Cytochrome b-c1 complex subunit 7 [Gaertneriomyces sp. JEL0708]|nr:Cytochrome b-c1 complex subunit 7 [Gaertneriomyces sp. JEL0708]
MVAQGILRSWRSSKLGKAVIEWHSEAMGYRKMGMRYDDLIPDEGPVVQEALRRLTPREHNDRVFRMRRALQASTLGQQLDPKEWTKPEQDKPYLGALMEQVEAEFATERTFNNMASVPQALAKRNNVSA